MLTADLVQARRRGAELRLVSLDEDGKQRATLLAARLIQVILSHVGRPQDELTSALALVDVLAKDQRLKDGLVKLLLDRSTVSPPEGPDPEEVRRDVFTRASLMRSSLGPGERLDRDSVIALVATARAVTPETVDRALFADLRAAQLVTGFDAIAAPMLVSAYERGQAQAVLLRAVKITVHLAEASPHATRAFFRRLKFLRLLHVITRTREGYSIVIDGPFSLFESITKYGLQLALVLPALEGCEAWTLEADIRWGKEKRPLVFRLEGGSTSRKTGESALPEEVRVLHKSFATGDLGWKSTPNRKILELPGVGLVVPDLVFERRGASGKVDRVYLEVMGYWSRAAVWQRVELVQAGLAERVLFAVSSRLRVSEEVLGDDVPGALYVYKGTMSARAIRGRLDTMCGS